MPRQYQRSARAVIGLGSEAIEVTGLRMAFEVTKTKLSGLPNACTLRIYNLAATTRARMEESAAQLRLYAGYDGVDQLLYSGQVRRVVHERDRTEWISILYCSDLAVRESTISQSFAAGTPAKTIIEAVVSTFGGALQPLIQDADSLPALLRPEALSGASKDALDDLAETYDLEWGFQDGVLEVSGVDQHINDTAIVISPTTGMVDSPVMTDTGIEVTCLLNPAIRVKRRVQIESAAAQIRIGNVQIRRDKPTFKGGLYMVAEVVFAGDTHGNDWLSRVKTYKQGVSVP